MTGQELFDKAIQYFQNGDPQNGMKYAEQAAEMNNLTALKMLANYYECNSDPGIANPLKAFEFYQKLANLNNATGLLKLGKFYCAGKCHSGSIGRQSYSLGRDYIRKGLECVDTTDWSDIEACYDLGTFVGQGEARENGRDRPEFEDFELSIKLLEKSLSNEELLKKSARPGHEDDYVKSVKVYLETRKKALSSLQNIALGVSEMKKYIMQ